MTGGRWPICSPRTRLTVGTWARVRSSWLSGAKRFATMRSAWRWAASTGGPTPVSYTHLYVTSKWGLEGLARILQMELEGTGVRATIIQPGQTLTEMGSGWDADLAQEVLESWIHWGLARHNSFLRPESVGAAVLAAVSAPRGTHLAMIEVQPEAPVRQTQ